MDARGSSLRAGSIFQSPEFRTPPCLTVGATVDQCTSAHAQPGDKVVGAWPRDRLVAMDATFCERVERTIAAGDESHQRITAGCCNPRPCGERDNDSLTKFRKPRLGALTKGPSMWSCCSTMLGRARRLSLQRSQRKDVKKSWWLAQPGAERRRCSPPPSLVKTTNATARAEHAATLDTRAKGVIPVRTASPTSTSAELPAGECAVTDGALAQNGLGQCGGRQRNSVVEAIP